jgi:hypothetical protein
LLCLPFSCMNRQCDVYSNLVTACVKVQCV